MVKITRKLTQELHQPARQGASSSDAALTCALAKKLSCCDGVGYRHETGGAFTKAVLCECVTSCVTCYGRARHLVDGVSKPCKTPSPARIVNIINAADIPARYGTARLDTFANFTGNGRDVLRAVSRWLQDFKPEQSKGLILGGPVGVGKTYLVAAIAKNLAARGLSVKFVDFFQLLSELRAAYANDQADASLLRPLIEVDVLIVDELGKGRNNDWELSILDQLVMGRYNQRKPIVASTNYGLKPDNKVAIGYQGPLDQGEGRSTFGLDRFESLESRVGLRIFSRLVETSHMVEISGDDFRRKFAATTETLLQPREPRRPEV